MTYIATNNVPRESYKGRIGRWLVLLAKAIWGKRRPSVQHKRPPIPNERMVDLNPHLLRDIGYTDFNEPQRYR